MSLLGVAVVGDGLKALLLPRKARFHIQDSRNDCQYTRLLPLPKYESLKILFGTPLQTRTCPYDYRDHRRRSNIFGEGGGGGGGSTGETKIAEGIRDAKNRRFLLYIAFAGKSGELQPLGSAAHGDTRLETFKS